jgi:hypothetical protein
MQSCDGSPARRRDRAGRSACPSQDSPAGAGPTHAPTGGCRETRSAPERRPRPVRRAPTGRLGMPPGWCRRAGRHDERTPTIPESVGPVKDSRAGSTTLPGETAAGSPRGSRRTPSFRRGAARATGPCVLGGNASSRQRPDRWQQRPPGRLRGRLRSPAPGLLGVAKDALSLRRAGSGPRCEWESRRRRPSAGDGLRSAPSLRPPPRSAGCGCRPLRTRRTGPRAPPLQPRRPLPPCGSRGSAPSRSRPG